MYSVKKGKGIKGRDMRKIKFKIIKTDNKNA